jgi:glycosyltransferase involved in cell wall biosynthesis
MNITYCWTSPSGYLAACMKELAARDGVNATLLTWESADDAPFDLGTIAVRNQHVLSEADRHSYEKIKNLVLATKADLVFICGWAHPQYVSLVHDRDLRGVKFVVGADTPIRFDWRQQIARLKIGSLLRKADAVCVPGERGFQVMRYWKVPSEKIARLFYGIDYKHFHEGSERRWLPGAQWPRCFAFTGRYASIKGVDLLAAAYKQYRRTVIDPWPLRVCGTGPMRDVFAGVDGIEDLGFVQPSELANVFQTAGVFVLPSRMDPWGQVVVEAAAAGLPIICTNACGVAAEVVRDYHSGLVIPPRNVAALTEAMAWMHEHYERLPAMGLNSQQLAAPYSAERWADNQFELAKRLCRRSPAAAQRDCRSDS